MTDKILSRQFHGAEGAKAWRVLPDGAYAFFRSDSFIGSARFIDAISGLVHEGNEPDIDIRGEGVTVLIRAFKGRDYGLEQSDLDLAQTISTTAREMGLTATQRRSRASGSSRARPTGAGSCRSDKACSATTDGRTVQTRI